MTGSLPSARRRPLRFLVVGLANTALSYGVYVLALGAGLNLALAGLVSLAAGVMAGFLAQGRFVFGLVTGCTALRYALAWSLMYVLHLGIVRGLLHWGISPYLGALAALAVLTPLSYLVLRDRVFVPQTKSR